MIDTRPTVGTALTAALLSEQEEQQTTAVMTAPSTAQLDEMADLVATAHAAGCRPSRWAVAVALGLDREDTAGALADLIAAGRLKRGHLDRDPDQPRADEAPDIERIARSRLKAEGQNLTDAGILGRVRELEANRPAFIAGRARHDRWKAEALDAAPRAVLLVAQARSQGGQGPTWYGLTQDLGWHDYTERSLKVRFLIKSGFLTATDEARSLDIGPLGSAVLGRSGGTPDSQRRQ